MARAMAKEAEALALWQRGGRFPDAICCGSFPSVLKTLQVTAPYGRGWSLLARRVAGGQNVAHRSKCTPYGSCCVFTVSRRCLFIFYRGTDKKIGRKKKKQQRKTPFICSMPVLFLLLLQMYLSNITVWWRFLRHKQRSNDKFASG